MSRSVPTLPYPLEKTLFLSDLDGTLLNSRTELGTFTQEHLQRLLKDERISLSFATAREYVSVRKVLPTMEFSLPIITANGTFLFDTQKQEPLLSSHFSEDEVAILRQETEAVGLGPLVYALHNHSESLRWIEGECVSDGARHYLLHQPSGPRLQPLAANQIKRLWEGEIFCLNLMDQKERLVPLYESLRQINRFYLIFHQELYRPEWWLSIYPKTVNKGNMARQLLQRTGKRHLVVFGDQTNDLPLFAAADAAYAVRNAHPLLQAQATAVLPWTNDEDAVVRFLLCALGENPDA